jgi:hypothetical protein
VDLLRARTPIVPSRVARIAPAAARRAASVVKYGAAVRRAPDRKVARLGIRRHGVERGVDLACLVRWTTSSSPSDLRRDLHRESHVRMSRAVPGVAPGEAARDDLAQRLGGRARSSHGRHRARPPSGSGFGLDLGLRQARPKSESIPITSPVLFISGPSTVSTPGNLTNGNTASFTEKCFGQISSVKPSSSRLWPAITRAASFASGSPIAFETKGTVRDARGFTSST